MCAFSIIFPTFSVCVCVCVFFSVVSCGRDRSGDRLLFRSRCLHGAAERRFVFVSFFFGVAVVVVAVRQKKTR